MWERNDRKTKTKQNKKLIKRMYDPANVCALQMYTICHCIHVKWWLNRIDGGQVSVEFKLVDFFSSVFSMYMTILWFVLGLYWVKLLVIFFSCYVNEEWNTHTHNGCKYACFKVGCATLLGSLSGKHDFASIAQYIRFRNDPFAGNAKKTNKSKWINRIMISATRTRTHTHTRKQTRGHYNISAKIHGQIVTSLCNFCVKQKKTNWNETIENIKNIDAYSCSIPNQNKYGCYSVYNIHTFM